MAGGGAYDWIGHVAAGPTCGEQGKLLPPKKFILPERDINRSEEEKPKSSFMQELDRWSESEVINPLLYAGAKGVEDGAEADWEPTTEETKQKIRAKVLESFRNGQAAGQRETNGPTRPEHPPRKGCQRNMEVRTSRWPVRA
jgi:hypothetical protein